MVSAVSSARSLVEKQLRRARRDVGKREQDIVLQRGMMIGDASGPIDRSEAEQTLRRLEEEQAMQLRRIDKLEEALAGIVGSE